MNRLAIALLAFLGTALPAWSASTYQLLTPRSISVAGGESQDVSIRFFDATGRPAAGETVRFSNDACGVFHNGQFSASLAADANGIATVRFTASNPPGITCWIQIAAGAAQATVDVLTYGVNQVAVQASIVPSEPRPGEPYVFRVRPAYGAYGLDNVDVQARVIPGTSGAALAASSGNTGEEGYYDFHVTPDAALGSYSLEATFRTRKSTLAMEPPANPLQDMWWVGFDENGWGMSVVQHGEQLFVVIYTYDQAGQPTWFVTSGGTWDAAHRTFTGPAYVPTGSPFYAYDPAQLLVGPPVGNLSITFDGPNAARLDYTLNGRSGSKSMTRHVFATTETATLRGLGDMWWGGPAQNGWGLAILQQYRTLFATWFTYDATGAPTWYVMPSGFWPDAQTYAGRIYRASSSPWLGVPYDVTKFTTRDVGTFQLRFTDSGAATFSYSIDGRSGTMPLTRTPF